MVTFRNNNSRRNNFRRNDRGYKSNGDRNKFNNNFTNTESFQRKIPTRNNHNASKLIDKYNNLAREALSSGDKILSESYFQHADHFTRILNEQENNRKNKFSQNTIENNPSGEKNKKLENLADNDEKVKVDSLQSEVN